MRHAALLVIVVSILTGAATVRADAVLFDFEEFEASSERFIHPGTYNVLECHVGLLSVIISRTDGDSFDVVEVTQPAFDASWGGRALDPWYGYEDATDGWFIATFSIPVTYVRLQMTDFGQDSDTAYIKAYSSVFGLGDFVGEASAFWGTASAPQYVTVEFEASDGDSFMSIMFRGYSSVLSNSMYVDNLTVEPIFIPEPAAASVLGVGLVVLASRRRK
ncbi:MAG: hypothetical protein JXL80_15240 [Planctomycetes bacterium]|nr:hypothetical protein [Planctomycetota bacterium]